MEQKSKLTAEYIGNLCAELRALAEANGYHVGAYLLQMACLEFMAQQESPDPDQREKVAC